MHHIQYVVRLTRLARAVAAVRLFRNWPTALRARCGARPPPGAIPYRLREGPCFAMEPGRADHDVLVEVWGHRIYEAVPGFGVEPGWVVLDLGAHKGAFAIWAARAGPATTVIAVEPEPRNLAYLRHNLNLNGVANVRVVAAAVGRGRGRAALLHYDSWSHRLAADPNDRPGDERVWVDLVGLDELVAAAGGHVDLAKIDIEGAEYAALGAASAAAFAGIERIVVECHPWAGIGAWRGGRRLRRQLERRGFRCRRLPGDLLYAAKPGPRQWRLPMVGPHPPTPSPGAGERGGRTTSMHPDPE